MKEVELTEEEQKLYQDVLSLDINEDYDERIRKLDSLKLLTKSLLDRKAIPEQRIKFFTDKDFQFGGAKKSRKEVFESNGTKGTEIFRHAHFIRYLIYFVEGANLDNHLIKSIEGICDRNHYSDDAIGEIYNFLKSGSLIPKDKSSRQELADEIFKLLVDLKVELSYCHQIRNKIRR